MELLVQMVTGASLLGTFVAAICRLQKMHPSESKRRAWAYFVVIALGSWTGFVALLAVPTWHWAIGFAEAAPALGMFLAMMLSWGRWRGSAPWGTRKEFDDD